MADIEGIFSAAMEIESADERAAYLAESCAGDTDLLSRVNRLLEAHFGAGDFLDSPASLLEVTSAMPGSESPGDVIGPYKLLEPIGEGGMGTVYMAEQTAPVQRKVALKIVKPGMDSRQVIARFEAERQALAVMDHPNIARMLDAGTTDNGRPYFVMELVRGVPITQYCDARRFTPRQRLELFATVCQAVQHAHQRGIIHRDLKPSNVLVAEYDDRPVAKIIDFGVAKAIGQPLTHRTLFTQLGQVVGTIEYMSPEQAKLNQVDIDTRTDIYSLGVLLYELLVGETPFDRQRLHSAAFDEVLRIIREEEPPKPSTRLSSSESLPSIAAQRQLEPKRLTTLVSGDLDWIVMCSLEKDRTRRYQTASGLADDIQRFLNDEAVKARLPTRAYRLKKFIQRNKFVFTAVSGIALSLIAGLGVSTWMFLQERQSRNRAVDAERHTKALAEKSQQVAIEFGHKLWQLGDALSTTQQRKDAEPIFAKAAQTFEEAARDFPEVSFFRREHAKSEKKLGEFFDLTGRSDQAEKHLRTAIREYAALAKDFPEDSFYVQEEAYTNWVLGFALQSAGLIEQGADAFRRTAELNRHLAIQGDAVAQSRLARQYLAGRGVARDPVEALKWFHMAATQGDATSQTDIGHMYAAGSGTKQDDAEAARWYRLAANQDYPPAQVLLGDSYAHGWGIEKSEAEAATLYHRAADHYLREGGYTGNADELAWKLATGDVLAVRDPTTAVELAQKNVEINPNNDGLWNTLGAAQYRNGNFQAAITALNKSIELARGGNARNFFFLAMALQRLDKRDEGRKWYLKGVEWTKANDLKNEELQRFRDEAAKTLGIIASDR